MCMPSRDWTAAQMWPALSWFGSMGEREHSLQSPDRHCAWLSVSFCLGLASVIRALETLDSKIRLDGALDNNFEPLLFSELASCKRQMGNVAIYQTNCPQRVTEEWTHKGCCYYKERLFGCEEGSSTD